MFSASCFSAIEVGNSEAASEHVALINLFFASRLQRLCWESAAATHVPLQTTIVAPKIKHMHVFFAMAMRTNDALLLGAFSKSSPLQS